ncbi:MAG TPA: M17 family peptidase N-terminal domain-containing protein [Terracidiphilus sp.]|nr:M17 family peptidase N-terminal domain-containing protein [Terracidiphilus sp.]
MRTELTFAALASVETPLLAVAAVDTQSAKGPEAKPQPELLTSDVAVKSATAAILAGGEFKAGATETLLIHAPGGLKAARLLIVGLGKQAKATVHSVRSAAGTAVRFAKPRGLRELVFALPEADLIPSGPCARAAMEGAFVGDFDPDTYRSDRKDQSVQSFTVAAPANKSGADQVAIEDAFREGRIVGQSQNFTRSLVNEPGNKLTPTILGQRAAEMAQAVGLGCVFNRETARAEDGRVLERGSGFGRAAGPDRAAL